MRIFCKIIENISVQNVEIFLKLLVKILNIEPSCVYVITDRYTATLYWCDQDDNVILEIAASGDGCDNFSVPYSVYLYTVYYGRPILPSDWTLHFSVKRRAIIAISPLHLYRPAVKTEAMWGLREVIDSAGIIIMIMLYDIQWTGQISW